MRMSKAARHRSCRARSRSRREVGPLSCSSWAERDVAGSCASRRMLWRSRSSTARANTPLCSRSRLSSAPKECPIIETL